jgi:hypothetical protein
LIVTEFDAASGDGGRTIVTGRLGDFTKVVVTGPGSETRTVKPAADGAFAASARMES